MRVFNHFRDVFVTEKQLLEEEKLVKKLDIIYLVETRTGFKKMNYQQYIQIPSLWFTLKL